jgi:hypothetical protein
MPRRSDAAAVRRRALATLVRLKGHRAGLRQIDVARMVGRPQSWVTRIESDDKLRVEVIESLNNDGRSLAKFAKWVRAMVRARADPRQEE